MTFHHLASNDQQFYHLHSSVPTTSIKDKSDFPYKNQMFDMITSNETFTASSKDCENSKRFSVNNLLKPQTESAEKINGKKHIGSN